MKYRELIKQVEQDGWYQVRQTGSHRHFHHPTKKGTVTIAPHRLSDELNKKTLNSILKQAGLK